MTVHTTSGMTGIVQPAESELVTYTHIIYALHALSVLIGIGGAISIVGSFVGGVPSIIAVIMNYVRRSATRGTFLETHFRWQIRTFWFALLWFIVVWAVSLLLMPLLGLGFLVLGLGLFVVGAWIVYRVVRGWLALSERNAMYQ